MFWPVEQYPWEAPMFLSLKDLLPPYVAQWIPHWPLPPQSSSLLRRTPELKVMPLPAADQPGAMKQGRYTSRRLHMKYHTLRLHSLWQLLYSASSVNVKKKGEKK